jgi:protein-tyrosine phosphatase
VTARADVHFHLLPGVDDGPKRMADSVELARLAVDDGTRVVVATPHVHLVEVAELPGRVADLQAALDAAGVPLEVRVGGELSPHHVARLSAEELETIAQGPAGARWLLIEAPLPVSGEDAWDLHRATERAREQGFEVLVGHPERCPSLFGREAEVLERELAAGSRIQVNASSLAGRHGPEERRHAFDLTTAGPATVVASDAHRVTRGPGLSQAERLLREAGVPAARARDLTADAPLALLEHGLAAREGRRAAAG